MTFSECQDILLKNQHIIGSTIQRKGINYRVQDIVSFPPIQTETFNRLYDDHRVLAINQFSTSVDLEVMLICLNITSNNRAYLFLDENKQDDFERMYSQTK